MKFLFRNEELVTSYRAIQSASNDAALLDTKIFGITFPTLEGFSIKKRNPL